MSALPALVHRVEELEALDKVAKPVAAAISSAVSPRLVRNILSGTPLGHPLHPMLTDVPIGAWTMSAVLDMIGGRRSRPAADLLVGIGVLSAVPTAASGLNDWSDTLGGERRVGFVHALANTTALTCYLASSMARMRGHRFRGKLLGMAGLGAVVAGGYLGGHLSFVKGVNVNRTAYDEGPGEWTAVLADGELADGASRKVDAAGVPVLLVRTGGQVHALANTCSHMGGPLDEGTVADGCVTCPWHGSTFRLSDGSIVRGPASTKQPRYETRVSSGQIEVRAAG